MAQLKLEWQDGVLQKMSLNGRALPSVEGISVSNSLFGNPPAGSGRVVQTLSVELESEQTDGDQMSLKFKLVAPQPQLEAGELKCWRVSDGELHWFAAKTEEEAKQVYLDLYSADPSEDFEIAPESRDRLVVDEDSDRKELFSTIMQNMNGEAGFIASTMY